MRPKDQGTRLETAIVERCKAAGLTARRLAEGGVRDGGDIEVWTNAQGPWGSQVGGHREVDCLVIEAKARQQGNVTRWLAKAKKKAANADLPFIPAGVVVWWKRVVPRKGAAVRVADGEREVVVMDVETFLMLLGGRDGV